MVSTKFIIIKCVLLNIISLSTTTTEEEYKLLPDLFKFDDYDKCFYYSTASEPTYCTITVELLPKQFPHSNHLWDIIERVSSDRKNYRHDLLRHGICASRKCGKHNETIPECLSRIYKLKYGRLGLDTQINQLHCETKESEYVIRTKDFVVLIVLGTYVGFVVLASVWLTIYGKKSVKNEDTKISSVEDFLSAFSLSDNIRSIMHKNVGKQANNYLPTIQGVRFFASFFLIVVHTTAALLQIAVANPESVEKMGKSFVSLALYSQATFVQAFFVISSFLMTFNFYSHMTRVGKVTLGYTLRGIVKRYIRFTSGQAILIAFCSTWFVHLYRGPFWEQVLGSEYRQCSEKWWTNLLYISNFFFDLGSCLPHLWYLSVDFQLTVIGLLILWLTQNNSRQLFLVSGMLLSLQVIWTFIYLGRNNFEFSFMFAPELGYDLKFTFVKEWQATWITTISNLAGLAWGFIFGYMYSHRQNINFFTKRNNRIWWSAIVTVCTLGTMLFSAYYKTTDYYSNSRWFAATYGSMEKVLCVFGMSLFIFGTLRGLGGFVRNVLEWAPMHTLGKLSFGTYLIHVLFLWCDNALKRNPTHFTWYLVTTEMCKNLSISYLGSVILTSFVLMPTENLVRKFL
ncbi:nose resistant to fluoxetine protein 6-like [Zophobas morio]|uniref:nose resistant to fluoxetine protein 6-like n=1 Tax=Zophobas morio TaxID=2755281 RepID=UPI003083898E